MSKIKHFFSVFGYSLKLVDMQKLVDLLRGYLEFVLLSGARNTRKLVEIHNNYLHLNH